MKFDINAWGLTSIKHEIFSMLSNYYKTIKNDKRGSFTGNGCERGI